MLYVTVRTSGQDNNENNTRDHDPIHNFALLNLTEINVDLKGSELSDGL